MKKFFAFAFVFSSFSAFSQSYFILNNGVTLTTDKAGFIYDLGNFTMPNKVTLNGGQFLAEEKILNTVDASGLLFNKDKKIEKVRGKGINYVVNDDKLITIDSKGFYYEFDKDSKSVFKKIINYGGKFFISKPEDRKPQLELYTINDNGNYFKIDVPGLNLSSITKVGGNFFQTSEGVVFTISKDGFVYSKAEVKAAEIKKAGGNFFVDAQNTLYTVSDEGYLLLPVLPGNLNVSEIEKLGANYFTDTHGKLFTVDSQGNVFERTVNHDLLNIKILSL